MLRQIFLIIGLFSFCSGFSQLNSVSLTKEKFYHTTRFKLSLLNQSGVEFDSILIQNPFQDIIECFVSNDSNSIFIAYSSDGTNKITKGITLTFVRFKFTDGKAKIDNEAKLLWAANPKTRRFQYSYVNDELVFKDKKNSSCLYSYHLNSFGDTKNLVRQISKDLVNSSCGDPDW